MSPIAWILLLTLTINELSTAAFVPRHILKRQINLAPELSTVLKVAPLTQAGPSKSNEALPSTTGTFSSAPEALNTNSSQAPPKVLETSVVIETKSSHTVFPVKNPTPQEQREQRIFVVFPEPPNNSTSITEEETSRDGEISTVAPDSEESIEEDEEEEEDDEDGDDEDDVEEEENKSIVHVESRSDDDQAVTKSVTTEAPTTTTTATPTTTTTAATTTTTASTSTTSSTTSAPSTTARSYRGTPRAPKNKLATSTTSAPVTTSKAPVKNTTVNNSSESEESKESTTHKTPHFEVVKKEPALILKPATRPSARLVEFLKNKKPGSGKRFQLHPAPENATSTTESTTTTTTTKKTTTSTAAPETTTKARRIGAFNSRGKTKMLEKSASETHAVAIAPPMEVRRARFFSSASSMLSGFVPAVPMPRATSQMVTRNSRASCANPAGCISPDKAEVLMAAVQETIKNSTVVADTATTIRDKIQSRRNNPPRRRTTAAPSTTTMDAVTIKSSALRLAQRRRPVTKAATERSIVTTAMPSLITMKQILDIVVTPAPIMVSHGADLAVQQPTTFKPMYQRFKALEKRVNPVASLQAQVQTVAIN